MKNIIVSAQIGAAGNLVKNLITLSHKTFWPTSQNRLQMMREQYPIQLHRDKKNWVDIETRLHHTIKNPFLIEFDTDRDIKNDKPSVFLNHSLFWQRPDEFLTTLNQFNFVFVIPRTRFGLEWQCRSAFEKVLRPKKDHFYDFCFEGTNKQHLISNYINTHGYPAYEALNVANMREIFLAQQKQVTASVTDDNSATIISLEDLLLSPASIIIENLNDKLHLELDIVEVDQILKSWRSLHWPLEDTFNWIYGE